MSEEASQALVIPGIGQVVSPDNPAECAQALSSLKDLERQIREAKALLTDAIVNYSRLVGTKTITLSSGERIQVRGGPELVYDAQEIEEGLREAGCPEERIREIVKEEVSYKVNALEAKRAAGANEEYAAIIERARVEIEKPYYIVSR